MRRFGQGFKLKKEIRGIMRISFIFIIGNKKFQKTIFWFKNTTLGYITGKKPKVKNSREEFFFFFF